MKILRTLFNLIKTAYFVFAGLWLGGQVREMLTGQPASVWQHRYVTKSGRTMTNFPVITKFWPAVILSFFGKPRWLAGLLTGFAAGALVDDSYEDAVLEIMAERMGI